MFHLLGTKLATISMPSPRPHLRVSRHPRYKWEVVAAASCFGRAVRHYHTTHADAQRDLADLLHRLSAHAVAPITRDEQLLLARWRAVLPLSDMEDAFRAAARLRAFCARPLTDVLADYLADLRRRFDCGDVSKLHEATVRSGVARLRRAPAAAAVLACPLRDLTTPALQVCFDNLPAANRTRINLLNTLRAALNWCVRQGWLSSNPATDVVPPPSRRTPPGILTPPQLVSLLAHADVLTLRWLVFGAFCGLRSSEVARLSWEDIRWDDGQLYVSPGKTRLAERWVSLTPPVLAYRDRLLVPDPPVGRVLLGRSNTPLQRRRFRVALRAKVVVPDNALRHSYASHHLVHHRDPARTALELGHHAPAVTFNHYRRAVSAAQAAAYWSLSPV